ncbi:protein-ADP-ribose hydrolase [Treponema pectinovorum]|uniref:protein-ADP-ribose hydrolase n=1 Tax=Treponema pectinovorum TaxID=164 RepID=UPI0011C884BD|nr:protein-ADP-ribose hydrolase [Treponema pectinovorum]
MTQSQRRLFLITELLSEDSGEAAVYFGVEKKGGVYEIPNDEKTQRDLLRALMNIRQPLPISNEFLKIQDEYLQELNRERGFTDIADLKPVKTAKPIKTVQGDSGNYELYLWQGDITTLKVDAIVNAANSQMLGCFSPLHACIDNCIHTYAGIQLRLECDKIMKKQGHAEPTGQAKITNAYNLPCKYVLHTVGPIINFSVRDKDKTLLASCYKNCLEKASEKNLESVAFCCISTGVFRFPAKLAAEIAVQTVEKWLSENPHKSVKKIVFNVFTSSDLQIYRAIFGAA